MPRPRARSLFELGGQWIAEEPGRGGFYRFWNDPGNGRTRRASLGTEDLETAKSRLAEIVVRGAPKTVDTHLTIVLEDYFTGRTDHLPSKKPARHAGKLLLECWGDLVKVSVIDDAKQKEFVDWSIARGHALAYVARNMGVLAAALERAKIAVPIVYNEGEMLAKWPLKTKAKRQPFIPSDHELARLLRAALPENLRRWLLNSMATGGRPEAVLDLAPASRRKDAPLLDLNPPERTQNKKYRATVRMLPVQRRWLDKWEEKGLALHGHRYCGYSCVDSIDTVLRRACAKAEIDLPKMSVYSIRHKVATVLRAAKVPSEQLSHQLGHRRPEERTTRGYGEYDPRYLAEASTALDAWVTRVLRLSREKPKTELRKKAA